MEDVVWRRVLYAVCFMEAALLATILVVVVVEPDRFGIVLSPRTRQLCALGALMLMTGCAGPVVGWLYSRVAGWTGLNL
jgi:hypothetical protein